MKEYHFGLIGYPLGHSRSPAIHTAALCELKLAGEYRLFSVPSLPEGAAELLKYATMLRKGELSGLNITIPHKQSILPMVDRLLPAAQAIDAVNTLVMQDGCLIGENTDAPGFLVDLQRCAPDVLQNGGRALVLGAGGAARAIIYALTGAGFEVIIAARRLEEAHKIASRERLSIIRLDPDSLTGWINSTGGQISLIVNTTSVGMSPQIHASPWPESVPFPTTAVVYDLVYNPRETRLSEKARQAGLRVFTGMGMLVEQAALSFELWTGQAAPRQVMRRAVEQPREV